MQRAIVVGMVNGTWMPPLRIDVLKTMDEPAYAAANGCGDVDCRQPGCLGNRIELVTQRQLTVHLSDPGPAESMATWHFDYDETTLRFHIVHGKNDRRMSRQDFQLRFDLPPSDLSKLLLAHISAGRRLLTLEQPYPSNRLFVNDQGKPFTDVTFVHYWGKCMLTARAFDIQYYPPSRARTIFVEEWTAVHQEEPDMWDGAAAVMGNSVEQWRQTYNPSRKRRLAQLAVDTHMRQRVSLPGVPDL